MEIAGIRVYTGGTNRLRSSAAPVSQVWRKLGIGNSLFLSRIRSRRLPLSETSELRVSNSLSSMTKSHPWFVYFLLPQELFVRGRGREVEARRAGHQGGNYPQRGGSEESGKALGSVRKLWDFGGCSALSPLQPSAATLTPRTGES